jgi:hypothetical protein
MNSKFRINYNLQYLFMLSYMSKYCKLWLTWNLEGINIYLRCCNWTFLHMSQQSAVGIANVMRARRTRKQGSIPVTEYVLPACPLLPDRLWNKYIVGKGSEGKKGCMQNSGREV